MTPRDAILGELSTLLGAAANVNSTQQGGAAQTLLYKTWGFERQHARGTRKASGDDEGYSDGSEEGITSDDAALLALYLKKQDPRLKLVLKMRALVKERSYIRTATDADGRVRTGLNLVATPTGRMASYKSPTGTSRLNMQTITKRLRGLFVADPGCLLFQRDLSGADGWTVAAHCLALGDATMMEDFRGKLKPQSILALIYLQGEAMNTQPRPTLKTLIKDHVDESSWQYMGFKRVFHLSNYAGQPKKMSESILSDSWKKGGDPIYVPAKACEEMQQKAFHVRYVGVKKWHQMWEDRLMASLKGVPVVLETSYGHRHVFYGRKTEWKRGVQRRVPCGETFRYILACEPQKNTTHALKRAWWRQYYDPENRREDGSLRAEVVMLVHDSKISQAREEDREWMLAKDEEWFNNPLVIAGQTVTIPASSEVGKDWSMK